MTRNPIPHTAAPAALLSTALLAVSFHLTDAGIMRGDIGPTSPMAAATVACSMISMALWSATLRQYRRRHDPHARYASGGIGSRSRGERRNTVGKLAESPSRPAIERKRIAA